MTSDPNISVTVSMPGTLRKTLFERRGYVLIILAAVYSLSALDHQILAILLQPIKLDLKLSDSKLGFLSGLAFAIFYSTLALPIARFADLWKRTKVIAISLTIFSITTALCSIAANFWHLMLMRIGVGIGEAGTTPSSTSVIADLYPEESRGRAMALFAIGGCSGIFLGYALGGFLAERVGWRATFLLVSLPGLLLALLLHLTVKEPRRGAFDGQREIGERGKAGTRQVLVFLLRQRSFCHLAWGTALVLMYGYGFATWLPSYFQRSYGMGVAQTGFLVGVPFGVLGVMGMLASGALADRFGVIDVRWRSWLISIVLTTVFPFYVLLFLTHSKGWAIAFLAIPAALDGFYIAPMFSLVQSVAPPRMRATAVAAMGVVGSVFGTGIGPQIVGLTSDALQARFGGESLRYALLALTPVPLWAAGHFYWAARQLPQDIARAREAV